MSAAEDYPIGARVRFADATATVACADGHTVVASGTVNGLPIDLPTRLMVPVWTRREGREPTTVYVDATNILEVLS